MIDHGGKRGGFARACPADDENQPAFRHHDFLQRLRQSEPGKVRNLVGDGAHDHAGILLLHEDVDAEARHARYRNRKIAFQIPCELFALARIHECERKVTGNIAESL